MAATNTNLVGGKLQPDWVNHSCLCDKVPFRMASSSRRGVLFTVIVIPRCKPIEGALRSYWAPLLFTNSASNNYISLCALTPVEGWLLATHFALRSHQRTFRPRALTVCYKRRGFEPPVDMGLGWKIGQTGPQPLRAPPTATYWHAWSLPLASCHRGPASQQCQVSLRWDRDRCAFDLPGDVNLLYKWIFAFPCNNLWRKELGGGRVPLKNILKNDLRICNNYRNFFFNAEEWKRGGRVMML